ncbi:hypothetical protein D3C85_1155200 [compost metagenome]
MFQLFFHVFLDQVHRHMPRTFNDRLYIMFPCNFGQFTQCFQFGELRFIIRIGNTAWS